MRKTETAVLQLGSTQLIVMIGKRGANDTFIVSGEGACVYGGYKNGEFIEPEKFSHNLNEAIEQAERSAGIKIEKLYVGVPTDFCRLVVKDVSTNLKSLRKVQLLDIENLFNAGDTFSDRKDFVVINRSPIHFIADDGRKSTEILGYKTEKLSCKVSYVLAERAFTDMLENSLKLSGIHHVEYLSTALAEMLFLFDSENRRQYPVILADIGNMDSSLIIGQGDGLLSIKSFPCGGGYLTLDLFRCFKISLDVAESLKRKIVLSLSLSEKDKYQVLSKGKFLEFSSTTTNEIVKDRIEQICDIIAHSLKSTSIDLPSYIPLHLTGGGLSYIRGVKDFMSKKLSRPVEIACPRQPLMDKPELSQILALLNLSLDIE